MREWQPIETAPKDGTRILIVRNIEHDNTVYAVKWFDGSDGFGDKCAFWLPVGVDAFSGPYMAIHPSEATHWMPLPLPPKVAP